MSVNGNIKIWFQSFLYISVSVLRNKAGLRLVSTKILNMIYRKKKLINTNIRKHYIVAF